MNIYKILFFILCTANTSNNCAERAAAAFTVTQTPSPKQITPTSYLINYPTFPKGIDFKHLDKFKEFLVYKTKRNSEATTFIESHLSTDNAQLSLSLDDCKAFLENPVLCVQFVKRFFRFSFLIFCINTMLDERYLSCGQAGICCNNNLATLVKKIDNSHTIEFLLFFNRIQTAVANYQQKHDPFIFYLLLDPHFFTSLIKFNSGLTNPYLILLVARSCQAVRDMYRILINDLLLSPAESPDLPLFKFLDEQELQLQTYYASFNDKTFKKDDGITRFQRNVCPGHGEDCTAKHFFGKDNIIHFDSMHRKLIVTLPEEFKEIYRTLYNSATAHGSSPLQLLVHDEWSGKLRLPIFFSLTTICETHTTLLDRVEKKLEKGAKTIAAEVKAIMKDIGLNDAVVAKQEKKGPKKLDPIKKEPVQRSDQTAAAEVVAQAEKQPSILYTFNTTLNTKKIAVDERVAEWYTVEKKECVALKKQGYLTPGTDRNRILEETIDRCGTRPKAIQDIIFRHQLPYSLMHNILSYGTIIPGSTNARTDITAIICVKKGEQASYYQGEITGEIKGKTFRIWHSFLRPIDNISDFMENTLEGHNSEYRKEDYETQDEDSHFTLLGEEEEWRTDDQESHVIISRHDTHYVLFKN